MCACVILLRASRFINIDRAVLWRTQRRLDGRVRRVFIFEVFERKIIIAVKYEKKGEKNCSRTLRTTDNPQRDVGDSYISVFSPDHPRTINKRKNTHTDDGH